jgi:hypothetical protein
MQILIAAFRFYNRYGIIIELDNKFLLLYVQDPNICKYETTVKANVQLKICVRVQN